MSSRTSYLLLLLVMLAGLILVASANISQVTGEEIAAEQQPDSSQTLQQSPMKIGEIEDTDLVISYLDQASWRQVIRHPGAAFIKVHLAQVDLMPGDRIVVSNADETMIHSYPGSGFTTGDDEGIWALTVLGDTAIIELQREYDLNLKTDKFFYEKALAGAGLSELGVRIEHYTRGYPESLVAMFGPDSTCGNLDRTDVVCYEDSHPTEFDRSHAVARLTLLSGSALCTSWRVSPGNFVLTNEHCISSQSDLNGVEFWFNYQRLACESGPTATPTIVTGDTFLLDDYTLDFALVTLDNFQDIEHFGYLDLDPRTPVLGEEIYIPQHGAGNPKEFGIESDFNPPNNLCQVDDAIRNGRGTNTDTGYFCDTIGGSSGSPVLARSTHKAIAIHHYGTGGAPCNSSTMNGGVRMDLIYPLIQGYFPPDFTLDATPAYQEICSPDPALYDIDIAQLFNFNAPVDLEANGLPAGSTATFSEDPVIPPASVVMTATTDAVAPGTYSFDIIGSGQSIVHTSTVTMTVRTQDPTVPVLLSPADGAVDVDVLPTLTWQAVDQTTSYQVELATDAGFTDIVFAADLADTEVPVDIVLAQLTTYYWHVRAANACAMSNWSPTYSFTTEDVPPILLVDDDDNDPDLQNEYRAALDYLVGIDGYNLHDNLTLGNQPTLAELSNYDQVIWFTGDDGGGSAGPDASGEAALSDWLDVGGCLLVSSQDYLSDRGLTPLITGYLGIGSASSDVGNQSVSGRGSVFGALGTYSLDYPFTNRSDLLNPNMLSELAFSGNYGNAAVNKDGGDYRTAFLGFPWEAIPTENDRQMTLASFLSWCRPDLEATIDITPTSVSVVLPAGASIQASLIISNTGSGFLNWQISGDTNGDCQTIEEIDWIELMRDSGTTVPGSSLTVEMSINSDGADAGTHGANLCVSSNDDTSPMVAVPVEMTVSQSKVYIPWLEG